MKKRIFQRVFEELSGVIHVHSQHSFDSDESVVSILKAARKHHLRYICFTDHNNLDIIKDPTFTAEKDIILVPGFEVSDRNDEHHLLVFNNEKVLPDEHVESYLAKYHEQGAITFAAHPLEDRVGIRYPKYLWHKLEVDEFDGLEIWNFLSSWLRTLHHWKNAMPHLIFPQWFIRKPYRKVLQYWDDLNLQGKRKVGIGALDAHGSSVRFCGLKCKVLTHRSLFKYVRTNVLLPVTDRKPDGNDILSALKNGHCYVVNYYMGRPYNFYAAICSPDGDSAIFGEDIAWQSGMKLYFHLPKVAKVNLYCDGKRIAREYRNNGYFHIDSPGFYRLEILRFGLGWIYTNPIYVTST